jgi:benzodiazapine receptor
MTARLREALALAGWMALTFAAAATGAFVSTGGWYAALVKPSWNPPGWLFGPVWTLLYALMAAAAWMVWRAGGWRAQRRALGLYLCQWALNALWTPLFFGFQRPDLAFAGIVLLDLAVLATAAAFWRVRPAAGLLLLPYILWVAFATVLNFAIWRLNVGEPPADNSRIHALISNGN